MKILESSRELVKYINSIETLEFVDYESKYSCKHIVALYTEIILQAGLNYNTVVLPRVKRVENLYPEASTIDGLINVLNKNTIQEIINWNHEIKIKRIESLISFSRDFKINSVDDLKEFLIDADNREIFLSINGVGNKTLDYTLKLLNFDVVAVDRHIINFIELAGINHRSYFLTKKIVEYAADFLEVSRTCLDSTIWNYMSKKGQLQYTFDFKI